MQKRESGGTDGDKSSGTRSAVTPSTPVAESVNDQMDSRISNSLITDSSPSADIILEIAHDRADSANNFSEQEMSLVCVLVPS